MNYSSKNLADAEVIEEFKWEIEFQHKASVVVAKWKRHHLAEEIRVTEIIRLSGKRNRQKVGEKKIEKLLSIMEQGRRNTLNLSLPFDKNKLRKFRWF